MHPALLGVAGAHNVTNVHANQSNLSAFPCDRREQDVHAEIYICICRVDCGLSLCLCLIVSKMSAACPARLSASCAVPTASSRALDTLSRVNVCNPHNLGLKSAWVW